jgi:inward rectifier potassium channel
VARKKKPAHQDTAPYPRIIARGRRPQRRLAVIIGQDRSQWTDFYQAVLSAPWWLFLSGLAAAYFATNAVFAGLYMLDPAGIENARPGSFRDALFFSMQTLGTYSTNVMAPKSFYVDTVVTIESFFSVLNIAIATGAVFARVSRPTARVIFSRHAVVTAFEGVPTLMFRVANQRGNQILEAAITVTLARQITTREGHHMRRFMELPLVRARSPLFALSWTVMHPIDENSPIFGATRDSLVDDMAEFIVVLSGTDETFADTIYARHSYMPDEIHWNKRFADIISVRPDGRRLVDLGKFHSVNDTEPS